MLLRNILNNHIIENKHFLTSLDPIQKTKVLHNLVESMYDASERAIVGPMASVAGAIAEELGLYLLNYSDEIIIENGGDIWLYTNEPVIVEIFPGNNYFNNSLMIKIAPELTPLGISTSSGKIGTSLSFGNADAVTILAKDASLADALATAYGNKIQSREDLSKTIEEIKDDTCILGAVIVYGDTLAACGEIEFVNP